jgi:hypothetical protein
MKDIKINHQFKLSEILNQILQAGYEGYDSNEGYKNMLNKVNELLGVIEKGDEGMKCSHNWCLIESQGKINPERIEFKFVCSNCLEIKIKTKYADVSENESQSRANKNSEEKNNEKKF